MSRLIAAFSAFLVASCGVLFAEKWSLSAPYRVEIQGRGVPRVQESAPPVPVVIAGGCPFEGCQYGKWTAREPVQVYTRVNGPLLKRQVKKGERVNAVSGEIHAIPRKATVTKVYKTDQQQGINVGSVVYALYPLGEGAVAVWHDGETKKGSLDLGLQYESPLDQQPLRWSWWVRIQLPDGTIGWLKDPKDFDGMDRFS